MIKDVMQIHSRYVGSEGFISRILSLAIAFWTANTGIRKYLPGTNMIDALLPALSALILSYAYRRFSETGFQQASV